MPEYPISGGRFRPLRWSHSGGSITMDSGVMVGPCYRCESRDGITVSSRLLNWLIELGDVLEEVTHIPPGVAGCCPIRSCLLFGRVSKVPKIWLVKIRVEKLLLHCSSNEYQVELLLCRPDTPQLRFTCVSDSKLVKISHYFDIRRTSSPAILTT